MFLVVAVKTQAKNVLKNLTLALSGVHLQLFPVNYVPKFCFLRPGKFTRTPWLRLSIGSETDSGDPRNHFRFTFESTFKDGNL